MNKSPNVLITLPAELQAKVDIIVSSRFAAHKVGMGRLSRTSIILDLLTERVEMLTQETKAPEKLKPSARRGTKY